ncbi:ankyrin repeat-containing protein [Tieghemostelium lacteum]|uniref:Ankyrin repeat-containing protein n=1 Tax=Tieghemostelium lacteum TaxID=361077 RepID=A0A151Z9N4_TIELA|nr:ankyrin repeat-containing protein [Tieghemostelium lacteum]|eukprot:KYQ90656.1 ankyrin repeat-containing protein [Tieghemostelium lacteum]
MEYKEDDLQTTKVDNNIVVIKATEEIQNELEENIKTNEQQQEQQQQQNNEPQTQNETNESVNQTPDVSITNENTNITFSTIVSILHNNNNNTTTTTTTTNGGTHGTNTLNNIINQIINSVKLEVYPHASGKYPVHEAVYKNDLEVLKSILGEDVIIDQQSPHNTSTITENEEEEEEENDQTLQGIPSGINERDEQGRTPLMFSNCKDTAQFLLERGARVNLRDHDRQTAMHKASIYNIPDLLSLYLDVGAHIKRDSSGCTPLHICAQRGHLKCVQTMMDKGPRRVKAEARDKSGKTPLHYACESQEINDEISYQIIQVLVNGGSLLDSKDREKKTPLHHATILGKVKSVNVLLEKGANTDIADMFGALPLHYAVTCVTGRKIAKQLISKGSKVNAPDNIGQTPIFYASKSGLPKNVTSLLRMGASATVKDYQSKTPLHFSLDIANPTISSMLVSAGADVSLRYRYGIKGEKGEKGGFNTISRKTWKGETTGEMIDEELNHADLYGFLPDVSLTALQLKRWQESKEYYSNLVRENKDKEKMREKKMVKVIKQWNEKYKKKQGYVQSLAWKTVSESIRSTLWRLVLDPENVKQQHANRVTYEQLLERDSEFVKQIDLDIDRTYRNHYIFRERFNEGQQSLFNILKAYSVYDPEVGYCQGMSSLVAMMLMYLSEEQSFWALVSLMESDKYQFRGLFLPSFPLLYRHYAIHEALLHQELPKVQNHFNVEGINTSMYATKWFLTIFSGNVPFPLLVRFWDLVLLNGYYIVHSFAIQLLREYDDLLCAEPFEKILHHFSNLEFNKINIYSFFKSCKKYRINEKKIEKLVSQYQQQQQQLHMNPLPIKPRSASLFNPSTSVPPTTTITSTTTTTITSTTTTTTTTTL